MKTSIAFATLAALVALSVPVYAETTVIEGIGDQWESLDPQYSSSSKDAQILGDVFEGLVGVDAKGDPIPGAAESWDVSADGLNYTFHLRAGLKWSNGDPVTAQEFVAGTKRQLDPALGSYKAYYLYTLLPLTGAADYNGKTITDFSQVGITAPDDRTVVLHIEKPNPNALRLINYYYISPLHTASFEKFGDKFIEVENYVSNGAYMVKEVVPQSHVLLVKNPNYWDAANVKVDSIKYLVTEDVSTEFKQFKAGDIDITNDVPTDQLDAIAKEFGSQLHLSPYAETDTIAFNTQKPPLDDIRIRKALALAIDRDVVVNKVARSRDRIISSFVPPVEPGYPELHPKDYTEDFKTNLALAKKLMAEAGYGADKPPLVLNYYCLSDDLSNKKTQAIALLWQKNLGVISRIRLEESSALYADFTKLEWDVYCDQQVGDYAGAEPFLAYRMKGADAGYPWENQQFEDKMNEVLSEVDREKRKAMTIEAEQLMLDDYPLAPLLQVTNRKLISSKIKGWVDNPIGYHLSRFLSVE